MRPKRRPARVGQSTAVATGRARPGGDGGIEEPLSKRTVMEPGARATEALQRQESRFRLLIEHTPDAVIVHRYGPIVYANPTALAWLGYEQDALAGRSVMDLIHPEDHAFIIERARRVSETCRPNPMADLRLLRCDGSVLYVEFTALPVEYDGEPSVVAVARNVTEEREMRARLMIADRMTSVGTLAAGVAHEINNPLAYLLTNLDFVLDRVAGGGGDEIVEALKEAREGAHRIRSIVADLKRLSRPHEQRTTLVDVQALLRSALVVTKAAISPRARIVEDFADTPLVIANEAHLMQVFVNLLINAGQAIAEGVPSRNEIAIATRTVAGGRVVISIRDTGCGIPERFVKRIFDPFFTTKPLGVGMGLGLWICYRTISSLRGEIQVESEEGAGTTVRVVLPAAPGSEPD